MKLWYVLWTYSANYSRLMKVQAATGEEAAQIVTTGFSADFRTRGSVFVFDHEPTYMLAKGRVFEGEGAFDDYRDHTKGE